MKEEAGSKRLILFRCDGVANTGLGHVSRSLAIAEGFADLGFDCHFIGRFEAGAVEMLTTAGRSFSGGIEQTNSPEDIQSTVAKARELSASGVFVDSYAVDDDYIAALHRQAAPVLLIDDYGRLERYECAALMCFLVGAADQGYPVDRIPCFLGPGYFPARKELRQLRREGKEFREKAGRALIAIGGVDLQDLTGRAARILLEIAPELSVHAVVGRHYERVGELSEMVGRFGGGGEVFVQLPTLAGEFAWADVVVSGGGMIKYESAYLGIPAGIIAQNEDQKHETAQFAGLGLVFDLGLGSEQDDPSLAAGLRRLLGDAALRESLRRTGLETFPADPTVRAAQALQGALDRGGPA